MNIFLVGFGLSESMKVEATTALRTAMDVYPQLDLDTLNIWDNGNAFAGMLHTNSIVASPREYIAKSGECLTLFTGTPISTDTNIIPYRAMDLAENWSELPKKLDGQFAAVRMDFQDLQLEVLTDPLGMEQVYIHHHGPTVVVSNNVRLIEQTCGLTDIDEIGASLFLALGWVGGDRTLRESVRVLPGGYLHQWKFNESHTSVAYWSRTSLAQLSQHWEESRLNGLAHSFIATLRDLSNRFTPFGCDLTGGRDSRVLAAALIAGGIPATFNTGGSAESADVQIATTIAEAFHLPHHINNARELVTGRWNEGVRRLIRQNDGMVNLWQVANSISQPQNVDNIPVWLWGIGGEIARGFYYSGQNLSPTSGDSQIVRTFCSRLVRKNTELLKEETRQLALQSVSETCQGFLNDGFEPLQVPQAFYAFDRVRRWAGANSRKASPMCDMFTPFCTIPFIETAFTMSLHDQITGRLHNELISATEPSLLDFPYNKPLSAMVPKRGVRRVVADTVREAAPRWLFRFLQYSASQLRRNKSQGGKGPVQAEWVEAKRGAILDVCLGHHSSVLWNYVDRRSFEKIMSSQTPAEIRHPYCPRILSIATLFHYEAEP